jgi:hypothetical protein
MPASKVRVSARDINSGVPGTAWLLIVENITIEMAVVGPDIRCLDDPKSAAMIGVIIAVYRPYSGGRPAMVAKATPCGRTITAPVNPAMMSAFTDSRLQVLIHSMNGNSLYSLVTVIVRV